METLPITTRRTVTPATAFVRIEDNVPVPVYTPMPTAKLINDINYAAVAAEYICRRDPISQEVIAEDAMYVGWTCLEVMAHRRAQVAAQGDYDSQKFIYERTLGKAVQQINQTNVNMTFADALSAMRERIQAKHPGLIESKVVDVDVVTPTPQSLADLE